ncbi:MAG: Ig-like domain-containing protein, partial [Spirochaetales bacterium]|nr:Ig-like domain-containing protein [Spirochaetales bacterium]
MKNTLLLILLAAAGLLLISCPTPLTEDVVMAASDVLPPTIKIVTPSNYDTYYSEVLFELDLTDDAVTSGDSRGDVAMISFSVSNDAILGGKITISSTGAVTRDESYGEGDISYNPETGIAEFSFDASSLYGTVYVTVNVSDRNSNETQTRITLNPSNGPYLDFTLVNENGQENIFSGIDDYLTLEGYVGNSQSNQISIDEIESVKWTIGANDIVAEIIIDDDGESSSYQSFITGYAGASNVYPFTLTPDENGGALYSRFPMKSTYTDVGSLSFILTVTDRNGRYTEQLVLVARDLGLAEMNVANQLSDNSYGHISTVSGIGDEITVSTDTPVNLLDVSYYFTSGTDDTEDSPVSVTIDSADDSEAFIIDLGDGAASLASIYEDGDDVSIRISATVAGSENSSTIALGLVVDNDGPAISGYSLESSNSLSGMYAGDDHSLDLTFQADDELGETIESINVVVGGGFTDSESSVSDGYEYVTNIAGSVWRDSSFNDEVIPVTITLMDRLDNSTVYSSDDSVAGAIPPGEEVTYYSGNPELSANAVPAGNEVRVSLESSNSVDGEFANGSHTMTFDIDSGRDLKITGLQVRNSSLDISGETEGLSSYSLTTSNLSSYSLSQGVVPFTLTLRDMAGNELTVEEDSTPVVSLVSYDSDSPDADNADIELVATAGTGVKGEYLNLSATGNDEVLKITDNGIDDNYIGYTYTVTGPDSFSNVQSSIQSSVSVTVDSLLNSSSLSGVDDGTYTAEFTFYDSAGNTDSVEKDFIVDRTLPEVSGITSGSDHSGDENYVNQTHTVDLGFSVSDLQSDVDSLATEVTILATSADSKSSISDGDTSFDFELELNGIAPSTDNSLIPYEITVSDKAGNERTVTGNTGIYYYYESLANTMDLTFSAKDSSDEDKTLDGSTYWVMEGESIVVQADNSSRDMSDYSITRTAAPDVKTWTAGPVEFSHTMTDSDSDGTQSFYIYFKDRSGNEWSNSGSSLSVDSSGNSIKYDSEAPVADSASYSLFAGDSSGVNGLYVNSYADGDEVISINYSSVDDNVKGYEGTIDGDKGSSYSVSGTVSGSSLTVDLNSLGSGISSLPEDDYTFSITRFYDYAGNESGSADDVFSFTVDRTLPTIDTFTNNGTTELIITFSENISFNTGNLILYHTPDLGSETTVTGYTVNPNDESETGTITIGSGLIDGTYRFTLSSFEDAAGNSNSGGESYPYSSSGGGASTTITATLTKAAQSGDSSSGSSSGYSGSSSGSSSRFISG